MEVSEKTQEYPIGEEMTYKLFLKKDNMIKIVDDWHYSFAPEVFYLNLSLLKIEQYELLYTIKNRAYYKFIKIR